MKDLASLLFGETPRVAMVRLFATQQERAFVPSEIAQKAKCTRPKVNAELAVLLRNKVIVKTLLGKKEAYMFAKGAHSAVCALLFTESKAAAEERRIERIKKAGKLKFIGVGGALLNDEYGGIEMVVVGDFKEKTLLAALKKIEEELQKEIRFMILTEKEFGNRLDVRDRLVYGLFERPHEIWFSKTKVVLPRLSY